MIDITSSELLTLSQAAKQLPNRPSTATIWRWATTGCRGGIKLETVMVGGRRFTTLAKVQEFAAKLTIKSNGLPTPTMTAKERQRSLDEADRIIDSLRPKNPRRKLATAN